MGCGRGGHWLFHGFWGRKSGLVVTLVTATRRRWLPWRLVLEETREWGAQAAVKLRSEALPKAWGRGASTGRWCFSGQDLPQTLKTLLPGTFLLRPFPLPFASSTLEEKRQVKTVKTPPQARDIQSRQSRWITRNSSTPPSTTPRPISPPGPPPINCQMHLSWSRIC